MKRLHLKEPEIVQRETSVLVLIRHEQLASPEERIMSYLEANASINNGQAREICVIREDWRVRTIFKKMVEAQMIEKVPGSSTSISQKGLNSSKLLFERRRCTSSSVAAVLNE